MPFGKAGETVGDLAGEAGTRVGAERVVLGALQAGREKGGVAGETVRDGTG